MEELISFDLVPIFEECYVIENLQINKRLLGFRCEKNYGSAVCEFNVYKSMIEIYRREIESNTFKFFHTIMSGDKIYESVIYDIQNILQLFKSEMKEYVERKKEFEQKSRIHISI